MRIALVVLLVVCGAAPLAAQERILSYVSEVTINRNGSLDVTEHITVRAEGREIRRGIYRDFPTRYRDRHGNNVVVGFEMLGVQRDGVPEPSFTENVANGIRINTGNDDLLPVPGVFRFSLSYRTTRQIGFFDEHDELYWNAIGTGWAFPIEDGRVDVRLPEPVPVDRLGVEAYTGPQGAQGQDYVADRPAPGVARYQLSAPLDSFQGFTIVLTFPKGIVEEPSTTRAVVPERQRRRARRAGGVTPSAALRRPGMGASRTRSAPRRRDCPVRSARGADTGEPEVRAAHGVRYALLLRGRAVARRRR